MVYYCLRRHRPGPAIYRPHSVYRAQVKSGKWRDPGLMGTYLGRRTTDDYPGITLGIIGLGRIGARVAQLFAPWRMRIIACDPYITDERFIRNGVEKVDLDGLLPSA